LQVAKSAIATVAAWLIAGWLIQGPPPVFAAIAALLVVQPSLNQSFAKAIERSVGVVVGVGIASALGLLFGEATWVVLAAIIVALLVAWAARVTSRTANQVAISAVLVLALGATTPDYAVDRILETIIGAIIGMVVHIVMVPPVAVAPAHRAVDAVGEELARSLERLSRALTTPQSRPQLEELLLTARLMRPMVAAAEEAIATATDSLSLNPRARRYRGELGAVSDLLATFQPVVTRTIGMTRAVYDHYDETLPSEPAVKAIAEQLGRAAHDVRLELRQAPHAGDVPVLTTTIPALTAPLQVATPSARNWVVIGSLLEDLRRIHEQLRDSDA
jgi:uncharacterized membrane protein YccC